MSLNESIVEEAALIMPAATLTRPLPAGERRREAIRRLPDRRSPRRRGQLFGIMESFDLKGASHE